MAGRAGVAEHLADIEHGIQIPRHCRLVCRLARGHKSLHGLLPVRLAPEGTRSFALHVLDVPTLDLYDGTRQALECSLHAHTLATAQLMGHYERRS